MANAGRVELNVVAIGEDQLSAMLAKLDVQANKTAETVKKAGNAAQTLGEQHGRAAAAVERASKQAKDSASGFASVTDKVKGSISPFNSFREVINQVRENVMFLAPGLAGLAAGAVALIADFLDTEEQLDATTQAMFDTATESAKLTTEMGKAAVAASKAARSTSDFAARIANLGAQAARLRGDLALAETFEREARAAQTQGTIKAAESQLEAADKAANEAQASLAKATKQQAELTSQANILAENIRQTEAASGLVNDRDRARLAAVGITLANVTTQVELSKRAFYDASKAAEQYAEEIVALENVEAAEAESQRRPTPTTPRTPGGGPRRTPRAPVDAGEGAIIRMDAEALAQIEGISAQVEDASERLRYRKEVEAEQWAAVRSEIDKSNDSLLSFLGTIEQAANAALPELGAGLQELASITEDYSKRVEAIEKQRAEGTISLADAQTKASEETTMAIIGGSTAVLAGLAKELGGLREFYLVKAAGEIAAGVATSFTNPAESASHFTAAALYGVAAARAGGGGGGGGGGAARGGGGGSNNQGRPGRVQEREGTSVINISTLVTDRATVRRTVGAVMARRDRSGYSRWEGT